MTTAAPRTPVRSRRRVRGADEILLSKITAPRQVGWIVPRPRIESHLTAGTAGPLTVVTGPPGAGKTTAVASWAAARRDPVAWVSLDRYDSRPSVFWSTVVAALRSAGVTFRRGAPAPGGKGDAGHVFLLRLASELAAHVPPVVLVLDDFHLVTGHRLADGLHYLMRNAGPGLRIVTCSRLDPMLSLYHYRLTGELAEIRAGELAFSVPEAALLMAQHGITLPDEPLQLLTNLYEGWAAGLRMAAISIQEHSDPEQFIKEFAADDSAVASYLVEEVLNNQPPRIRDLLLRTSILDRVSPGIAAELADDVQAASDLDTLARANAFVEPLGNGWYRYHSLFAEVLRLKLRFEHPGQVADLHRRAARWYQADQQLTNAVRQAVAADDWSLAARLVIDDLAIGTLIEAQDNDPLTECLRLMPCMPAEAGPAPALVAAAIALRDVQHNAGSAAFASAEDLLKPVLGGQEIPSRLAAATIRLELARRAGELETAAASVTYLEELLGKLPPDTVARHPEIVGQLLVARGMVRFWSGRLDEAADSLGAGRTALAASMADCAECCGYLALMEALAGRLQVAEHAVKAAGLPGERTTEPDTRPCSAAEIALALSHLERNELHAVRSRLKRADAALRIRPDKLAGGIACLVAARYRLAEGHATATFEFVARARQGWSPPAWLEHRLTLIESRAFAVAGDFPSAVGAAERADPAVSLDATVALAHAWLDAGNSRAAGLALERGPGVAGGTPDSSRLERWLVDARFGYCTGDRTRGRRSLERALQLGREERLRLPFAMAATWMRPVLRSDPQLADTHRHLLEPELAGPGFHVGQPVVGQAAPVIVEQLSGREREVLELLAGMLSTAEVASELYISVNTVKTHLKSIYRKLAATHRGEAVRRARQLQLI